MWKLVLVLTLLCGSVVWSAEETTQQRLARMQERLNKAAAEVTPGGRTEAPKASARAEVQNNVRQEVNVIVERTPAAATPAPIQIVERVVEKPVFVPAPQQTVLPTIAKFDEDAAEAEEEAAKAARKKASQEAEFQRQEAAKKLAWEREQAKKQAQFEREQAEERARIARLQAEAAQAQQTRVVEQPMAVQEPTSSVVIIQRPQEIPGYQLVWLDGRWRYIKIVPILPVVQPYYVPRYYTPQPSGLYLRVNIKGNNHRDHHDGPRHDDHHR